jgi:hypothetical protein
VLVDPGCGMGTCRTNFFKAKSKLQTEENILCINNKNLKHWEFLEVVLYF